MSPPDAEGAPARGRLTEVAHHDPRPLTVPQEQPPDCGSVLSLFDVAPAGAVRRGDTLPSVEAARTVNAARQRDVILEELGEQDATADDLAVPVGTHRSVVASRLAQLRRDGLVEVHGTRANQLGKQVQLWRLRRGVEP